MNKISVIITAAGSGTRLESTTRKQFLELSGKQILQWTIENFTRNFEFFEYVISLPAENFRGNAEYLKNCFPDIRLVCAVGGTERQDSVYNALLKCSTDTNYVMIHDGVRPFVPAEDIAGLIDSAGEKKAVIPAFFVKNTIKEVVGDKVVRTVDRSSLVNVLTPQIFEFDLIRKYYEKAIEKGLHFTDDAGLLEYFRIPVFWMQASSANFKITDINDLELADHLINRRKAVSVSGRINNDILHGRKSGE